MSSIKLIENFGMEGNFYAGKDQTRQISLIAYENIIKQKYCPLVNKKVVKLIPGDFKEDITTKGLDFTLLKTKCKLKIGNEVIIEISKKGRNCYKYCPKYYQTKYCYILQGYIFGKIINGGIINFGDKIELIN